MAYERSQMDRGSARRGAEREWKDRGLLERH
jgi:hypothetical protein